MSHPTPEQLNPLLKAVDVACWCLAVKENTRKGQRCMVDVKGALKDLQIAWGEYQLATSDFVATLPDDAELLRAGEGT